MYFLVFHGEERFRHKPFPGEHDHADEHGHVHVHERTNRRGCVGALVACDPVGRDRFHDDRPVLFGDFFKDSIYIASSATRRWKS